ncbi:carboxypeptidase-like regulatory domain-containing protein [Mucilaginibacter ximonensis]|uniref:Carboxypeptidase-like regulatory domain-containing protein n=1 Tax=Mucilaginibacter ximonensis TaxID=538021 RepID=A0ABW5YCA6_9SPHI
MSTNRNDISQINNYLKGKLDARAMYELERNTQDDPFLMDALDGFEIIGTDQSANLDELKTRLANRVVKKKERNVLLWRVLPIAACLLLLIGGYWLFETPTQQPIHNFSNVKHQTPVIKNQVKTSAPGLIKKPVDSVEHLAKNHPAYIQSSSKTEIKPIDTNNSGPAKNNLVAVREVGGDVKSALKNRSLQELEKAQVKQDYAYQSASINQTKGVYGNANLHKGKDTNAARYLNTNLAVARSSKNPRINGDDYFGKVQAKIPPDSVIRGYVKINRPKNDSYIITSKEVQDNPVGTQEQLLQGKVAGLNIQNNIGAPGMRGSVNIKGLSAAPDLSDHLISGKITDTAGKPLAGVTIHGANAATTTTDANGRYHVLVNRDTAMLVTGLGYQAQNIMVKPGQSKLDVKLKPGSQALAEVSIRGYVKRTRDQTTGASYIITGKECKENLRFKKRFFSKIAIAERYVTEHANGDSVTTVRDGRFLRALKFIAKRAPTTITADKTAYGYADLKVFAQNKERWLHWYEFNKCNNLK